MLDFECNEPHSFKMYFEDASQSWEIKGTQNKLYGLYMRYPIQAKRGEVDFSHYIFEFIFLQLAVMMYQIRKPRFCRYVFNRFRVSHTLPVREDYNVFQQ